jgi:hypothetical protein
MDDAELARIKFVTARYRDLQGLRHLAIVPLCLLLFWLQPYLKLLRYMGPWEAMAGLLLSVSPCLLIYPAHHLLDLYYARRFGTVGSSVLARWDAVAQAVLVVAGVMVDSWGNSGVSATLIAIALVSLQIAFRDWPWRLHHLIVTVLCIAAAVTFDFRAARASDPAAFLRIPLTIGLCAYSLAAYLDHRLLANVMLRNPDVRDHEIAADHADSV